MVLRRRRQGQVMEAPGNSSEDFQCSIEIHHSLQTPPLGQCLQSGQNRRVQTDDVEAWLSPQLSRGHRIV